MQKSWDCSCGAQPHRCQLSGLVPSQFWRGLAQGQQHGVGVHDAVQEPARGVPPGDKLPPELLQVDRVRRQGVRWRWAAAQSDMRWSRNLLQTLNDKQEKNAKKKYDNTNPGVECPKAPSALPAYFF